MFTGDVFKQTKRNNRTTEFKQNKHLTLIKMVLRKASKIKKKENIEMVGGLKKSFSIKIKNKKHGLKISKIA